MRYRNRITPRGSEGCPYRSCIVRIATCHSMTWCTTIGPCAGCDEVSHTYVLDENSEKEEAEMFTVDSYEKGAGFAFFQGSEIEMDERGGCILEEFADYSELSSKRVKELGRPEVLTEHTVEDLMPHYVGTFPGEKALEKEDTQEHWSPILNVGEESGHSGHRVAVVGRFSSTRALLMEQTESNKGILWASERRVRLDAWAGQAVTLFGLTQSEGQKMYVPTTSSRSSPLVRVFPGKWRTKTFKSLERRAWTVFPDTS